MNLIPVIRRMMGKRVLIVGDIMLDKYFWGTVSRISPEAPVQVVDVEREEFDVGGAGNTAANITSLSGEPLIIAVVGEDGSWSRLKDEMTRRRISTSGIIVDTSRRTTRKTRVMGGRQQLLRIDFESRCKVGGDVESEIIRKIDEIVDDIDVILVSDYAKGVITQRVMDHISGISSRGGIKIVVDPKPSNHVNYNGAYVITPNQREACELIGWTECPDGKVEELGKALSEKMGCSVLITRGEKGMVLVEEDGITEVGTLAQEVFDVSGAGDTVVATLGLSLAAGATLKEAALLANHAAGVVVGKVGTSSLTREELERSIENGKSE